MDEDDEDDADDNVVGKAVIVAYLDGMEDISVDVVVDGAIVVVAVGDDG